jgi:hypothetical protein
LQKIYVPLDQNRIEQLRRLAQEERRETRQQAAYIIEQTLDRAAASKSEPEPAR